MRIEKLNTFRIWLFGISNVNLNYPLQSIKSKNYFPKENHIIMTKLPIKLLKKIV